MDSYRYRALDEPKTLVQLRRQHLRAHALVAALHGSGMLALALGGGLLVELARAQLGEKSRFLHGALEAAQGDVERLVFLDSDDGHKDLETVLVPENHA